MNVYDTFFSGISHEEWEFFSADFLSDIGYNIVAYPSVGPDGGRDLLVEHQSVIYVVSCKHQIVSGASVGTAIEKSIMDRIIEGGAKGFIGFYSTSISSSLDTRFNAIKAHGYKIEVFDKSRISNHLPRLHGHVLQKYGLPGAFKFVLNVVAEDYVALNCLACGVDILDEHRIRSSIAMLFVSSSNELHYLYGCKNCLTNYQDIGFVEVEQSLYQEQLLGWHRYVDDELKMHPASQDFYLNKSVYESRIQQRMYPANWGVWLRL